MSADGHEAADNGAIAGTWTRAGLIGVGLPIAVAAALELGPDPLDLRPGAVMLIAVLVAALIGGARAGMFAAVASTILMWWQFSEPRFSFRISTGGYVAGLIVYAVGALLVVWLTTLVDAARRREREERTLSDTIIGEAPMGFALFDLELHEVRTNRAMVELNRQLANGRVDPGHPQSAAEDHHNLLASVRDTGQPTVDASLTLEPDESGLERHWSASYYPVRNDRGELVAIGALVQDVTEQVINRRRSELLAELARSLSGAATIDDIAEAVTGFLASVFHSRVLVAFVGAEGSSLLVHDSARGYDVPALPVPLEPGSPMVDVVLDGKPFAVASMDAFAERYPEVLDVMTGPGDEAAVWVPVTDPLDAGRVLAVFRLGWSKPRVLSQASTRLHETLAAIIALAINRVRLTESAEQDRFRVALDAMLDDVAIARAVRGDDGTIEDFVLDFVNRASLDGAGRVADDLVGRSVLDLYPGWRNSGMFERFVSVADSGIPIREERLRYVDEADGTTIDGYWSLQVAQLGDGYIAATRDMTDAVRLERSAQQAELIAEQHRIAVDLLQRAALPIGLPHDDRFELGATHQPAAGDQPVGGDWYDCFRVDDDRVALVIADVAGHGTEAAALMLQARNIVRAAALDGAEPGAVLTTVNRLLMRATPLGSPFVTCVFAIVDLATPSLAWARAGHLEPLIIGGEGLVEYAASAAGLPLGVSEAARYVPSVAPLRRGAGILLFTDGLVERRSESIDVGLDRLRRMVMEATGASPTAMVDLLAASAVDASDDLAIIHLQLTRVP